MIRKKTGTFSSFDGTKIYYEIRGEGPPIVLAYGIGCLMNHWRHQVSYFSPSHQIVLFDYRGHHKSDIPNDLNNLDISSVAKDLISLLDFLNIRSASFWGHSFGAQVLLQTYDLSPSLFHSLVLINGFASNPIKGMYGIDFGTHCFKLLKQSYKEFPETTKYFWKWGVLHPLSIPIMSLAGGFNLNLTSVKDIEIYVRGISSMDLDVFTKLFENMLSYNGTSILKKVHVPALIICGDKDNVTPKTHQKDLHRLIKGSQFQSVPYGTHCTQLDMPDFVNLRIEKFLNENKYTKNI